MGVPKRAAQSYKDYVGWRAEAYSEEHESPETLEITQELNAEHQKTIDLAR